MATFLFLLLLLAPAASELEVVKKKPGQDAILKCEAGNVFIRAAEWTRTDREPPEPVLFYRNGHSDSPYGGRVHLANNELKDGDVSLILRNVSSNDNGTYECRVAFIGSGRQKRANIDGDPIRIIRLEVTDSGSNTGNIIDGNQIVENPNDRNRRRVGLGAGLGLVSLAVAVGSVVAVVTLQYKRHTVKKPEQSAANEAVSNQLI